MHGLFLALAALPAGAAGQAPPATVQSPDVVVRAREKVERREAKDYARSASVQVDDQLARFLRPVCPMALGFPTALATEIVDRMRDVADAARIPLAAAGCKSNMIVMAAPEGGPAMLRAMKKLDTPLIRAMTGSELDRLIRQPGPVWSWTFTILRNDDGQEPDDGPGQQFRYVDVHNTSLLNPSRQQTIELAVVLIDWPAMIGKSANQIADYAAMRTLAKTRPLSGAGPVGSILSLFDADVSPPAGMTVADLGYLRSLYAIPGTRYTRFQLEEIASGVRNARGSARH